MVDNNSISCIHSDIGNDNRQQMNFLFRMSSSHSQRGFTTKKKAKHRRVYLKDSSLGTESESTSCSESEETKINEVNGQSRL